MANNIKLLPIAEQLDEPKEILRLPYSEEDAKRSAEYLQGKITNKEASISTIHLNIGYPNETFSVPKFYNNKGDYIILVYNNEKEKKTILTIGLALLYDGIQIQHIYGDREIRGHEIGIKIYEEISNAFKMTIYSGEAQTPNSRYGIWDKLLKKYPSRVVIYDPRTNKDIPIINKNFNFVYEDDPIHIHKWYLLKFLPQ